MRIMITIGDVRAALRKMDESGRALPDNHPVKLTTKETFDDDDIIEAMTGVDTSLVGIEAAAMYNAETGNNDGVGIELAVHLYEMTDDDLDGDDDEEEDDLEALDEEEDDLDDALDDDDLDDLDDDLDEDEDDEEDDEVDNDDALEEDMKTDDD
jgi:hypothetical protein